MTLLILTYEQIEITIEKKKKKINLFSKSKNKTDLRYSAVYRLVTEIFNYKNTNLINKQFIKTNKVFIYKFIINLTN